MDLVLRVTSGPHQGQEYSIDQSATFTVGRSSRVNFPMTQDLRLSREHFQLENSTNLCHLVDLGSTNGTKVNGLRVERVVLREGDVISAGDSHFSVHFGRPSSDKAPSHLCAGCNRPLGSSAGVPVDPMGRGPTDRSPDQAHPLLLCESCNLRRRRFPETAPDYLIEEQIGEGGMGQVYRALQLSQNRRVAIKMMIAQSTAGEKALNYFRREIKALQAMLMPTGRTHRGIVQFYELFEIDGHFQLVMEYVDGKNALDWAKALCGPVPISTAAQIGVQLLAALDYAHRKGYVHRDIKPSNILVMGPVRRPLVKLSDFGLAKSFAETNLFTTLTRHGDVGGSIGFLSPDHIRQFSDVKEPADIYSAGVTLFYLLTGKYPYFDFDPKRPDPYKVILEHPAVPLRAFRHDAPESLERILLKALQKQPRDRWKSAREMAEALRPFVRPLSSGMADSSQEPQIPQ